MNSSLLILAASFLFKAPTVQAGVYFDSACTSTERALSTESLPEDFRKGLSTDTIDKYLSQNLPLKAQSENSSLRPQKNDSTSIHRFAQLLTLRRFAKTPESKLLVEYLLARTFWDVDQLHLTHSAMTQIASQPLSPATTGLSLSALECLVQIRRRQPAFQIPGSVVEKLLPLMQAQRAKTEWQSFERTLHEALLQATLQNPKLSSQVQILNTLKGSSTAERLIRGVIYSSQGKSTLAIEEFKNALAGIRPEIGSHWFTKHEDTARILLARAYYTVKEYKLAAAELLKIKRSSNLLADALGELAWANLQAGQYGDAVGNARNLQGGHLKNTFTPEAPMIIAMTFNELCQFPQSLHAVKTFRNRYEDSYRFLAQWSASGAPEAGLYRQAIQFLKTKRGIPTQVGTEWIRSPLFQAAQREINLTIDERDRIIKLNRTAGAEVIHLMESIIELAQTLKPKIQLARMKLKSGESLPPEIQESLTTLRSRVVHLRRLQASSQAWRRVVGGFQAQSKGLENRLVARINRDLSFRSHRMVSQLEEVQENLQFVEIEIFNGASQDLIWKNANPNFKQVSEKLKEEQIQAADAATSGSWKWGGSGASEEEGAEIWEDELGSYTANLTDNCTNKEKYLALSRADVKAQEGN